MNPNAHLSKLVLDFNEARVVLNGCGRDVFMLSDCAQVPLESGYTKKNERYLRGSLISPKIKPYHMVYARKVKVIVGDTGLQTYLGRNGGFFIGDIPEGEHAIMFEYDRRHDIKTSQERRREFATRIRKENKKQFRRYNFRQNQAKS